VSAVSVVFANLVEGDRIWGECYFRSASATQTDFNAITHVYTSQYSAPDYGRNIVYLYKGGNYVTQKDIGLYMGVEHWGVRIPDAYSTYPGDWRGIGWHWARWETDIYEEGFNTEEYASGSRTPGYSDEVTQHHNTVITNTLQQYAKWRYFNIANSADVKKIMPHHRAVRLDVAFHTKVLPKYHEPGDYMPFLLVSPDGNSAMVVIEKPGYCFLLVTLTYSETLSDWIISDVLKISGK